MGCHFYLVTISFAVQKLKTFLLSENMTGVLLAEGHLGNCLPIFSLPGTQKPLQPQSRRVWLLLELATELGTFHIMLIVQPMQKVRVGSGKHPPICKEYLGGQTICGRVWIPTERPQEGSS
jgi:hypothetical protein